MELAPLTHEIADRLLTEQFIVVHALEENAPGEFLCAGTDTTAHSVFKVSARTVTRLRSFNSVETLMEYYAEKLSPE